MIGRRVLFFLLLLGMGVSALTFPAVLTPTSGSKYFQNYTPGEYDHHPQNWAVAQDKRGIIYVANQAGLLEYDGVSRRIIDIPNRTVRSLDIDDSGTIYIGGKDKIGFLAPEPNGTLAYVSLLPHRDR